MAASPREVFHLADQAKREDIDEVFVRYYDGGGYEAAAWWMVSCQPSERQAD
jgi:hypothetical protein